MKQTKPQRTRTPRATGTDRPADRAFPEIPPKPDQKDEIRYAFSPRLRQLATIHELIEDFGEQHSLPSTQTFLICLEIDELLTNYVNYAQHKVRHPRVELRVSLFPKKVVLEVIDTGPAFDPLSTVPPDMSADYRTRKAGGVGLHLVRSFSDRMHYECVNGCNRLMLEHDLIQPDDEPAAEAKTNTEENGAWQGG